MCSLILSDKRNNFQDEPQILGTTNGTIGNRKLFQCHQNHGKFVPISEIVKEEEFFSIITGDVTNCNCDASVSF